MVGVQPESFCFTLCVGQCGMHACELAFASPTCPPERKAADTPPCHSHISHAQSSHSHISHAQSSLNPGCFITPSPPRSQPPRPISGAATMPASIRSSTSNWPPSFGAGSGTSAASAAAAVAPAGSSRGAVPGPPKLTAARGVGSGGHAGSAGPGGGAHGGVAGGEGGSGARGAVGREVAGGMAGASPLTRKGLSYSLAEPLASQFPIAIDLGRR